MPTETVPPRVGDRITTADQLAALPEGAVFVSEPDAASVWQVWPAEPGANRYYGLGLMDRTWPAADVLAHAPVYVVVFLFGHTVPGPTVEVEEQWAVRWPDGEIERDEHADDGGRVHARFLARTHPTVELVARAGRFPAWEPTS